MNNTVYPEKFLSWAASFRTGEDAVSRSLAGYAAAIALADEPCLDRAVRLGRDHSVGHSGFYEIVLQSYLFLGFPRMLLAAEHLAGCFSDVCMPPQTKAVTTDESHRWYQNGMALCERVYGDSFEPLREHVESVAPEVFRWMIVEGYGKVLSRPGLTAVDRELAVVASLLIDNRPRQLHSHLKGASNVGADTDLIRRIIEDHKETAPTGYRTAVSMLDRINGSC